MTYIHNSMLGSHGHLRSSNCLIDSRWVLKITSFGLNALKRGVQRNGNMGDYEKHKRLLWTAPELLREDNVKPYGTKTGDIYSFGIVLQEILYRAMPFFVEGDPKG